MDQLVDIYVAALLYGSIIHTVMIREKIASYLQGLCLQYREHKLLSTTIKLLLLVGEEKKLSKFIESYGICTDNVTSEDVSDWLVVVSNMKIKYRRIHSSCLLLGFFGAYFNDRQYEKLCTDLKSEFITWTEEQYAGDLISKAYLSAMEKNQYRIPTKEFFELSYLIFEKGLKRWYDDVFGVLSRIRFEKINDSDIEQYVSWLLKCVNDEEIAKICYRLPSAIQNVRLQRDDVDILDEAVKNTFQNFYKNEYSLNVFEHDLEDTNAHIDRLIKSIEEQNETQGKGGCYSGYASNPYRTIENILVLGKVKVPVKEISKVLNATLGTLRAERQTLESKVDAWKLITIIFMKYPTAKCVREATIVINKNVDVFLQGKDIFLREDTMKVACKWLFGFGKSLLIKLMN